MTSSREVAGAGRQTHTLTSLSTDTGRGTAQHRLACWARACCHVTGSSQGPTPLQLITQVSFFSSLVPFDKPYSQCGHFKPVIYSGRDWETSSEPCVTGGAGNIIAKKNVEEAQWVSWIWSYGGQTACLSPITSREKTPPAVYPEVTVVVFALSWWFGLYNFIF